MFRRQHFQLMLTNKLISEIREINWNCIGKLLLSIYLIFPFPVFFFCLSNLYIYPLPLLSFSHSLLLTHTVSLKLFSTSLILIFFSFLFLFFWFFFLDFFHPMMGYRWRTNLELIHNGKKKNAKNSMKHSILYLFRKRACISQFSEFFLTFFFLFAPFFHLPSSLQYIWIRVSFKNKFYKIQNSFLILVFLSFFVFEFFLNLNLFLRCIVSKSDLNWWPRANLVGTWLGAQALIRNL